VELSNREWATLFWLAVLLAFIVWKPDIRQSAKAVVAAFITPKILIPLALFVAWMTGVIWVGARLGIWQPSMVKDALFWTVPGFVLFMGSVKAAEEPRFFRHRLWEAVGLTALLEFYLNSSTLDLAWELLLQPVIFLLASMSVVSARDPKATAVKRLADALLAVIVIGLLVPPTIRLISDAATFDAAQTVRALALPAWLTLGALPFIYVLSLYSSYELVFVRMRISGPNDRVPLRAKLALVSTFHIRHSALHAFAGELPRELVLAKSFRGARRVIADQQAELRAVEAARQEEVDDLARYAGVKGMDAEGRQLDRREFKETANALEWLHTMQIGWYHNQGGRYRDNLVDSFADVLQRHGLREDRSVTMQVSRSGQSWFAWCRTPSGWCFAIGAGGPPPDEWYFDGPEPPRSYPGRDRAWGDLRFEPTVNWPG
jgi:hypothetical protein